MKIVLMAVLVFALSTSADIEAQQLGNATISGDYSAAELWIVNRTVPSLVLIEVNNSPSGFGFVINGQDGIIITTKHSFRGSSGARVTVISTEKKRYEGNVIGIDDQNDFVLIKALTQDEIPAIPIHPISDLADIDKAVVMRINRNLAVSVNP